MGQWGMAVLASGLAVELIHHTLSLNPLASWLIEALDFETLD